MNHDLKVINQRAYQWKMEFNPDPNKQATELSFSCKRNSPDHPSLFFNGTVVPNVNEQPGSHTSKILLKRLSKSIFLHNSLSKLRSHAQVKFYFSS